jgi:hypothetical protein
MKALILALVALLSMLAAKAQHSGSHSASLTLTGTIEIAITRGQQVTLNFNTPADYAAGITTLNAATVRIRSNFRYNLTVRSASSHFNSLSATPMPVSGVLAVRVFPQGQFINLSGSDALLLGNQSQGTNNINVSYRATPGFNYDPGIYTANIIYTATMQ